MPIRVVLIGDLAATVGETLAQLPAALDVVITGVHCDRASADHALRDTAPDAVVVADDVQGWGRALVAMLPSADRPRSIVIVSPREDDAVRAFELQATDFVPMPLSADRLREAMIRVRHQVLQAALLRTADELQRLLGEVGQVEELRDVFAGARAGEDSADSATAHANGSNGSRAYQTPASQSSSNRAVSASMAGNGYVAPPSWESRSRAALLTSAGAAHNGHQRASTGLHTHGTTRSPMMPAVPAARTPRPSEDTVLDLSVAPVKGAVGRMESPNGRPIRILVRDGRRTRFVPVHEIDWFEADGNYIVVHTGTERFRTRGTISAIEAGLDARQFVRIHRGRVVNMDRVRELSPLPGGDGLLVLADGKTLRLSRTYRARVR